MLVAVIGAGYVGLVTSACLAQLGHRVTCLEVDSGRLFDLQAGKLPIYEPSLDGLVEENVAAGRLTFVGTFAEAVRDASFAFIAVPTPALENGHADTRHVFSAAREVLENAPQGLTIIVKSTVPVGTGDAIAQLATFLGRPSVSVVSNPEFLRQGGAVRDFFEPDRVVIGADDHAASRAVARLYDRVDAPILFSGRRSAEMAKYASNALLATRISFMNEIAAVCEATGADIEDVARIVGADERIGPHFLRAGLGWGGSCFPKDVLALAATAAGYGIPAPIVDAVLEVNRRQRDSAARKLIDTVGAGGVVGILGLAFKPDTDDLRGSPALDVIAQLKAGGVTVRAHDPVAMQRAAREVPELLLCGDAYSTVDGTDAVLLATEWPEYVNLDWSRVRELMRGETIVDGRNALDGRLLLELGFRYHSFGRAGQQVADHDESAPLAAGMHIFDVSRAIHGDRSSYGHGRSNGDGPSIGHGAATLTLGMEPVADSSV